ncbi:MAG: SDR family oxidoreductase [Candidatus Dadabacteria bacterium]|nr:MAG: SDR family oxidoreductase [Candidatus Dadabacteria bacterium]
MRALAERYRFRDKVVWITGGGGGIGAALARDAASRGAQVAVTDIDGEAATRIANELGTHAAAWRSDVTDFADCQRVAGAIQERFGGIDVLINNAGVTHLSRFRDTPPEVIERVLRINVMGAVHCTKAALEPIIERRGRIAALSSVAGIGPLLGRTGYSASKHALHGFFDSLRAELTDTGVGVTLICPSFANTDIGKHALFADGDAESARTMTGPVTTPEAIAAALLDGIERGVWTVLPGRVSKLAWWLSRNAPRFYSARMRARLEGTR